MRILVQQLSKDFCEHILITCSKRDITVRTRATQKKKKYGSGKLVLSFHLWLIKASAVLGLE